jgi:hypothetical protein
LYVIPCGLKEMCLVTMIMDNFEEIIHKIYWLN